MTPQLSEGKREDVATLPTLYAWSTPNGQKPIILLEELGMAYHLVGVDVGRGHQLTSRYLDIAPHGKVPTLIDHRDSETITVSEAGAILIYLAEREGQFLPKAGRARVDVLQWLMYQMTTVGPMLGEANHFRRSVPEPMPYVLERYLHEARQIFELINRRLSEHEFIAGDYSIADIALYPWLNVPAWFGLHKTDFPHIGRWGRAIGNRPAVQTARGTRFAAADWEEPSIAM
ncbi:MAG: glutathione S-transferase N-terminal domain-containing protein [Myxococcota bacterium]